MTKFRGYVFAAALALTAVFGLSKAEAAPPVAGTCATSDVTATNDGVAFVNAVACLNYSGNDTGYEAQISTDFAAYVAGTDPWSLFGKSDDGSGKVTASSTTVGQWSVNPLVDSPFVIVLKAADFFAAYLFTGINNVGGGAFTTIGVTADKARDLSHLSVYTGTPSAVPVPAALPLLLTGLAGLGWLGRRRKSIR